MSRKNYQTTRNKELRFWKSNLTLTPKHKKSELLDKTKKLMEIFPNTPIWKDLHNQVKLNKPLSVKQLGAINNAYKRCVIVNRLVRVAIVEVKNM
jgi:hypothetical protein